jgi:[acyl-carrier-protein] S-malonyltransferase
MGRDLVEGSPEARELFDRADQILGFPLSRLCLEGPEEDLRQTMNTQPAIFLHSMVLARLLQNVDAQMAAGHSLGEYAALVWSGALSFDDGLRLVRLRGELMQQAGAEQPGTMAAVIGLNSESVEAVCSEASAEGVVQAANFNSPGQVVVSGSRAGVRRAMELARQRGARLTKELPVSGAFHSPLMASAREGLAQALERVSIRKARVPVYANVTAEPVQDSEQIRDLLVRQLTSPVRWQETVQNMRRDGATVFIEIGPGNVLQGLVRRIVPDAEVRGVEKLVDVAR